MFEDLIDETTVVSIKEICRLKKDDGFGANILKLFRDSAFATLECMHEDLSVSNYRQAQLSCHKLKGSCYTLGAKKLGLMLDVFEQNLKLSNISKENLFYQYHQVQATFSKTLTALTICFATIN